MRFLCFSAAVLAFMLESQANAVILNDDDVETNELATLDSDWTDSPIMT